MRHLNIIKKIKELLHVSDEIKEVKSLLLINNKVDMLAHSALKSEESGITDTKYSDSNIIVSLTTYGPRLQEVYLTIESIMNQSMKPNKIILWLEEELRNVELPLLLKKQINRGLEIKYCKNIRSYKKLIPSLLEYPNDVIITIDDDLLYNVTMLEHLILAYLQNPNTVHYNRGHLITFDKNGFINKYNQWKWFQTSKENPSLNFPTTGGGVLYPPKSFNEEVFNEKIFMSLCPTADDIWFKAMLLLNNTTCNKVYTTNPIGEEYIENKYVQITALSKINVENCQNDTQLKNVFDYYNLYSKLK